METFRRWVVGLLMIPLWTVPSAAENPDPPSSPTDSALAREILSDDELRDGLGRARSLLGIGLTAGSGYGEVWIRDLNTFIELALEVNEPEGIRRALLTFFAFQGEDGNIVDGYILESQANVAYEYRRSSLGPGLLAHKNTVETDQEASLVQAISRYVGSTGDRAFLQEEVDDVPVVRRLEAALEYLLKDRLDADRGLLWGATTVDWGDVQPEHEWGVVLDESSHRAIDIYDNAMFLVAIDSYLELLGDDQERAREWTTRRDELKERIREHLWDAESQKFVPHIYLEGSPFPDDFDENRIWYHGGTAVAIEAGVLSRDEIRASLERMTRNVREAGAGSIGLTVYPPYPAGFFKNPDMAPWSYQNGGDWCWFGGRMIQQLVRYGFVEEAYRELKPMVTRALEHDGFYEWWTRDNQPRGSGEFRGSAGVLGRAIEMLLAWAEGQGAASAQTSSE